MAIQFARTAYVSRSSGGNACLKAAYNERSLVLCQRTGEVFNFKARGGNVYHTILLPDHVDLSFKQSSTLWNVAENSEKRKNSQIAKEAVLALPDDGEITLEHRIELTESFIKKHFVDQGLAAQIDIHAPHEKEKNWHAHILLPTRRFKENGLELGEKARDLNQQVRKGQVVEGWDIGEAWKEHQNAFFIEHNINLQVDPIGIVPQEHLGPVRMRVHMGEAVERALLLKEANEEASRDPYQILQSLTKTQSIFHEGDIDRYLSKHVEVSEQAFLKEAILNSENVLSLYERETNKQTPYFTTKEVRAEEEKLLRFAEKVDKRRGKTISLDLANTIIEAKGLYAEQKAAALYTLQPDKGLAIVEGKAGTGKSYTMQALKEIYEKSGYRVMGLAPTNQVSQDMKKDGFRESHTVHSFLFQHKNNRLPVNKDTIFIVDEAAMLSNSAMIEFLHVVKEARGKAILFGDDRQLASVERGDMLRTLIAKIGSYELSDVIRQKGWQKEVSELLARDRTREAARHLSEQGAIHWGNTKEESMSSLIQAWTKDHESYPDKSQLILAKRNVEVDALNKAIREVRLEKGEISARGYECQTARGKECFSQGDRICFTQTDKKLGIANGIFGEVKDISEKSCSVQLDNGNVLSFNPEIYQGMKLGYASTVYKSQGKTIDSIYTLHDRGMNKRLSYVALTRQSSTLKIFANTQETKNLEDFMQQISRSDKRVPSLTFATAKEIRNYQQQHQDLPYLESIKGLWQDVKRFTKMTLGDKFHENKDFYTLQKTEKIQPHPVIAVEQKLTSSSNQSVALQEKTYKVHQHTLTEREKQMISGGIHTKDQSPQTRKALTEEEKLALSGGLSQKQANKSQTTTLTNEEKLILSGRQKITEQPHNQAKTIDQYGIQQDDISKDNHLSRKGPSLGRRR